MTNYWYPKADRSQDFSARFSGSTMNTDTVTLHSTEGTTWPSYSGGATAPNMTIMPDFKTQTVKVRQHFAANKSARALENRAGGVNTNTQNTFQIELVGTCDPATHKKFGGTQHIYMPEAPDWFLKGVADVIKWLDQILPNFKVADGAPRGWGSYPGSYGTAKGYRMSFAEWNAAKGIVGHQHIPENSHGDPGSFPIAKLVAFATGTSTVPPAPTQPAEYDKMNPSSYFEGVVGPHVTWLGQRLVVHGYKGYKVGPGPSWGAADKAGVTWFQKRQGWTGSDADGYPGKETLKRLAAKPVIAPPKPEGNPDPNIVPHWFKLMSWNLSGNNATGVRIWGTRRSKVVKEVLAESPDVFCTQENIKKVGKLTGFPYLDANLKGYKRVSGGDGRYIYIKTSTVKYIAGGVFNLHPYYNGDDKQAAWAVLQIKGKRTLVTSYHLENEGTSDSYRIQQMNSCLKQATAQAEAHDVPIYRIFNAGDSNFRTQAAIAKVESWKWLDAYSQAKVQVDKGYKSLNSWRKPVKGFRIDRLWVRVTAKIRKADQRLSLFGIADHNAQIFDIGQDW